MVSMSDLPAFHNDEVIPPGIGVLKNRHLLLGVFAIAFYVGSEVSVGSWIVEFVKDEKIAGLDEVSASYFLSFFWGGLMIGRLMAGISLNSELTKNAKYLRMVLAGLGAFFVIYFATGVKFSGRWIFIEYFAFH